jgi:ankyrin repeat protein
MRNIIIWTLCCGLVAPFGTLAAEAPGQDQLTRYFRSVQVDDAKTVLKLIEGRVVNPNQPDPRSGETGLILALREGAPAVAAALIALPGIDLEAQAPNGNTALMMAAFKHNRPAVEALLAKGAKVDRAGWNALHFAAAAGDDDIIKLLLEKGARIDARAPAGFTALMLAAREGQESTVATLLAAGADATLVNSEQMTAAQIAERAEKPRIAAAIRQFTK